MTYCTEQDIIQQFKLNPKQFGLEKDDTTGLNNLINKWIIQAMSAIDYYLDRDEPYPDGEVPAIVELACTEAVGNIITNRRIRQDGSYIKSDDWTKDLTSPLDILDGVRELLDPLTPTEERYDSSYIQFYAVTGKREKKLDKADTIIEVDW